MPYEKVCRQVSKLAANFVTCFQFAMLRSKKNTARWYLLGGILSWVTLTVIDLAEQYSLVANFEVSIPVYLKGIFLNGFLLLIYLYVREDQARREAEEDFHSQLLRTFTMSMLCSFGSLVLRFLNNLLLSASNLSESLVLINFVYHVDFVLLAIFLITAFTKWKNLILYNSSSQVKRLWQLFEYGLFATLLLHFFRFELFDWLSNITMSLLLLVSLVLSFNLKWVPFLNFRQKLSSVLYLLAILGIQAYFVREMFYYVEKDLLVVDILHSIFFVNIYIFTAVYGVISFLVVLFNLPTTSVFEKKISEVSNIQQLSKAIVEGKDERRVYTLLLDGSLQSVRADAAFLNVFGQEDLHIARDLSVDDVRFLRETIRLSGYANDKPRRYTEKFMRENVDELPFLAMLCMPIKAGERDIATLVLLKRKAASFDTVAINTLNTFVAQAGLAVANFRLVAQALQTQRYREEIKIARRVHDALLPEMLESNDDFDLFVKNESADEVGGDYYDFRQLSNDRYGIIIADVSGKGTSAAFNMAQLKGIFHTLMQFDPAPDDFLVYANNALSSCLERRSFITASYFIIDTSLAKIYMGRAGHCPTLHYDAREEKTEYLPGGGIGLGIVRSNAYVKHAKIQTFPYTEGDLMMFYTDGIIEARHPESKEEYGYERLKDYFDAHKEEPIQQLANGIVDDIKQFMGVQDLGDDYTILLLRFHRDD